jgi:hypothetical protein
MSSSRLSSMSIRGLRCLGLAVAAALLALAVTGCPSNTSQSKPTHVAPTGSYDPANARSGCGSRCGPPSP